MGRIAVLAHVLKLGNRQLAEVVVDDSVAAALRELSIALMSSDNARQVDHACGQLGREIIRRLESLEEAPLKAMPWSRPSARPWRTLVASGICPPAQARQKSLSPIPR